MFSPAQEVDLGEVLNQIIQDKSYKLDEPELTAYLQQLGDWIAGHLPPLGLRDAKEIQWQQAAWPRSQRDSHPISLGSQTAPKLILPTLLDETKGTRTVIWVPSIGFDVIDTLPFTRPARSRMLMRPRP